MLDLFVVTVQAGYSPLEALRSLCPLVHPSIGEVLEKEPGVAKRSFGPGSSRPYSYRLVDVFTATIPDLPFAPAVHVNYAETVLPIRDGLPKLRDFPAEFGGSGEVMPE